jgi:hypothetical protein
MKRMILLVVLVLSIGFPALADEAKLHANLIKKKGI